MFQVNPLPICLAEDSYEKNQAFFSLKDKSKKLKCCLLQFLFGTLRFKNNSEIFFLVLNKNIHCNPLIKSVSEAVLMMDHNICFLSINMEYYPQIIPVTPSYLEH